MGRPDLIEVTFIGTRIGGPQSRALMAPNGLLITPSSALGSEGEKLLLLLLLVLLLLLFLCTIYSLFHIIY